MRILRLLTLSCLLMAGTLMAQTADEIIASHLKAIGGVETWRSFSSVKYTGNSKWGSMEIPFVQISMKDGSNRNDVTIQGLKMITAYDSKTGIGWSINPFQGSKDATKMNEEELQGNKENGELAGDLACYKEKGWKVELLGKDDVDGVECFKLMLSKKSGTVFYYYIDTQTWYIIKVTAKVKFEDREFENDTQYSDFQTVNGVVVAFSTDNISNGQLQGQSVYTKVEFNVEVPAADFVMPEKKKEEEKK